MKEGALVNPENPKNENAANVKCKLRKQKSNETHSFRKKIRMLYLSLGSPYILREPFIYICLIK
jgi:hypothetical protein